MIIANKNRTMLLKQWQEICIHSIPDGFMVVAIVERRHYPVNLFKGMKTECEELVKDIACAIESGCHLFVLPTSKV